MEFYAVLKPNPQSANQSGYSQSEFKGTLSTRDLRQARVNMWGQVSIAWSFFSANSLRFRLLKGERGIKKQYWEESPKGVLIKYHNILKLTFG